MNFKELLEAIQNEVSRLDMSNSDMNSLVCRLYQKQWFIQLTESEQLDLLLYLRGQEYGF